MKKKIIMLLLSLLAVFGFSTKANALTTAPDSFTTYILRQISTKYVNGVDIYYKELGYDPAQDNYTLNVNETYLKGILVYCEDANLRYDSRLTMLKKGKVNDGYIYILENAPKTANADYNYYVTSTAVWWYKDILTGGNNISASVKNTITNGRGSNATYKAIYDLVYGAVNYKQTTGYINFSTGNVYFALQNGYYVSSQISVSFSGNNFSGITLENAPTGSVIFNQNITNGNGTFQVKVPVSSLKQGQTVNFNIKASGNYTLKSAYDYVVKEGQKVYKNGKYDYTTESKWQRVLLGEVFKETFPINASKTVGFNVAVNSLTIKKVDENGKNVVGAELTIYSGDCTKTTCTNKVTSFTTTSTAKNISNISVGTYTLVETKTPDGYETANKILMNITSIDGKYSYTMVDKHKEVKELYVLVSKTDEEGKALAGATLVIKNASGTEVAKWVSTKDIKKITLTAGSYTLIETSAPSGYEINNNVITFKLTDKNETFISTGGLFVLTDKLTVVNKKTEVPVEKELYVNISKTDLTKQKEIPGATLVVKNEQGEEVAKWVSTTESKKIVLKAGVYTLTETVAPNGYILSTDTITFKLDENNNVYEKNSNGEFVKTDKINMVNVPKEAISINKLDSDTNEFVSGATLNIKNTKGEEVAAWVTENTSKYITLDEGEYILTEASAPSGYVLNSKPIYFSIDSKGELYVKDDNGDYVKSNGIIMYNTKEEIIEVPATGISNTLIYVIGSLALAFGAISLYKNEKKC